MIRRYPVDDPGNLPSVRRGCVAGLRVVGAVDLLDLTAAYPEGTWQVIDRENYLDFII